MSKFAYAICTALATAALANASAENEVFTPQYNPSSTMPTPPNFDRSFQGAESPSPFVQPKQIQVTASSVESSITPFTGKVRGKKVRLRAHADLESRVMRELDKHELLSVVGEKGDFYAVEIPPGMKAYVFRSFVLDNVVEGNRVNVRLEPDLDAPIIGHLHNGDRIDGNICGENSKWLEIAPPSNVHFYVAKEFIENVGGPEVKVQVDKRKAHVEQVLENASFLAKSELRKPFEEIDIERLKHTYKKVITDHADFPDYVEQARDALAGLQENYMQKRIAFLEEKANSLTAATEEPSPLIQEETVSMDGEIANSSEARPTDKMLLWQPIEEALYLNWAAFHEDRTMQEYYSEQKEVAVDLSGIVEAYTSPVKNKPGDFVLKDKDLPVGYIYSTQINLQNLVGKRVHLLAVPRPNNNFAFPAYFVVSQE